MQRRIFLKLSAAGAASMLWACQESTQPGGTMLMTHAPGGTRTRVRVGSDATSSSGASFFADDEPMAAASTREVHVLEPGTASSAFDRQGYEYRIEPWNGRVVERGMMGVLLREFGTRGLGADQLNHPVALAFGPDDNMYVADRGNDRVQVFDRQGHHLRQIGGYGSALGQLSHPSDLLFDAAGRLLVADTLNHRVQVFETSGRSVALIGSFGTGPGLLNGPSGLALAPDSTLHVLDAGNARVVVFDLQGEYLRSYGERGAAPGQLALPRALALAKDGTGFVADVATATVEVWSPDGRFEQRFEPYFEDGSRAAPVDVALAPDGDLYISAVPAAA